MNDPNFFSESNGESKGLVDNSPGGGVYPDKKAQSGNFGKKLGPRSAQDVITPKQFVWHIFRLMIVKEDRIANPERLRNPNYLYWFRRYEFLKLTKNPKIVQKSFFYLFFLEK